MLGATPRLKAAEFFSNQNTMLEQVPYAAPSISASNFARRVQRVRAKMQQSRIDVLVVSSIMNHAVRYLGFFDPDLQGRASGTSQLATVLLPLGDEPRLLLQTFTSASYLLPRVHAGSLIPDVQLISGTHEKLLASAVSFLKDRNLAKARIGIAGGEVDWTVKRFLQDSLTGCTIEDCNSLLDNLRIIKDDEEIALLRRCAQIGDEGIQAVRRVLREGISDFDLYAAAEVSMRRRGADEDTFNLMGIGPNANPMLMESLNGRLVRSGNVVVFEVLPFYRHYNTELAVTFSVGRLSAKQRQVANACKVAYEAGLERIRPGTNTSDVVQAALSSFSKQGFHSFTHTSGHFIGLDNYEGPPLLTPNIQLEPGMVFSFHPNIVIPGEVKEEICGILKVTEKGVENLSRLPTVGIVEV